MNDRPVAFLDSGVGGLPYLAWARERLPAERFVYLADRANFPYGPKSPADVLRAVVSAVESLLRIVNPKAIVIACNTATVVALAELRRSFPAVPFVGVVPAVKPASEHSAHRRIGVLATRRTVEDPYLVNLIETWASDCLVVKVAGGDIVEFVEKRYLHAPKRERFEVFRDAVEAFGSSGVDSVVLGCTHFLFLHDEIRESLPAGVEIIDSREGVGRQLMRVLSERGLSPSADRSAGSAVSGADPANAEAVSPSAASVSPYSRFYVTGTLPVEERYREFASMFGLEFCGTLEGAFSAV